MKFHVGRNWQAGALEIYALSDDGTQQMTLQSAEDGNLTVQQEELPEGTAAKPFMRLSGVYAEEFEAGFKRFLSQQEHIVPKDVYEREARRVDDMIETIRTVAVASVMPPPPPESRVAETRRDSFQ